MSERRYSSIAYATRLEVSTASTTVFAPRTTSPEAKSPARHVHCYVARADDYHTFAELIHLGAFEKVYAVVHVTQRFTLYIQGYRPSNARTYRDIISGMGVFTGHPCLHSGFLQFKHLFPSAITYAP